jgi:hypothetical protein
MWHLMKVRAAICGALLVCAATCASAQDTPSDDTRGQYPAFMRDSYFSLNGGAIGYLFSDTQLEPGFRAESIDKARIAVRIEFFGHHFTKNFAAHVVYMRPGFFVKYNNVNGSGGSSPVSNAYAGLLLAWNIPLTPRTSAYVEGGYGVTSRSGFEINGRTAVPTAHYGAGVFGGGITYALKPTVDFVLGATYTPGRQSFNQPSTRMYTTGLRYTMRALPATEVASNQDGTYFFPANVVQFGVSTNVLGYGVNELFGRYIVIFFSGHVETRLGATLDYERNVYHSRKRFAFDLGFSASAWESNEAHEAFRTLSAYPLVRYFLVRGDDSDVYFAYSVAGPTFITQSKLDGLETGANFTFQDKMAVGAFIGRARRLNIEIGIKHFSNGNLATTNAGIKIPLTFSLGVTF